MCLKAVPGKMEAARGPFPRAEGGLGLGGAGSRCLLLLPAGRAPPASEKALRQET